MSSTVKTDNRQLIVNRFEEVEEAEPATIYLLPKLNIIISTYAILAETRVCRITPQAPSTLAHRYVCWKLMADDWILRMQKALHLRIRE
jgi:hypothetical protein